MVTAPGHAALILSYLNEIKTGNVLNGRYLIEEQLGSGGMGSVYAARHVKLGTRLAIKVLLPELLSDSDAVGRFAREARAAAKIADENVVRILDVGELDSGVPFMVMEFLEGQDVAAYLKENGRLSIEHAIDVMLQSCAALTAAHAMHIIHRDIKPSNLFFVPRSAGRPLVKMLDFGVSKIVSAGNQMASQLTKAGSLLGSPGYTPPEQWFNSNSADTRWDIWSLGILFYELLTGRVPFEAPSLPALSTKIAYESAIPPRHLRREIPLDVENVVLRCLEKQPDNRFQDVIALAMALRSCQQRYQSVTVSSRDQPLQARHPARARGLPPFPLSTRAAMTALLAMLVIVGIGVFLLKHPPVATQPPEALPARASDRTSAAVAPSSSPSLPPNESGVAIEPSSLDSPVARLKTTPAHRRSAQAPAGHAGHLASGGRRHPAAAADPNASHCNPPYYFNAQGSRVFKIECL